MTVKVKYEELKNVSDSEIISIKSKIGNFKYQSLISDQSQFTDDFTTSVNFYTNKKGQIQEKTCHMKIKFLDGDMKRAQFNLQDGIQELYIGANLSLKCTVEIIQSEPNVENLQNPYDDDAKYGVQYDL